MVKVPYQLQNPDFRFVLLGKWDRWGRYENKNGKSVLVETADFHPMQYEELVKEKKWKPLGKAPFEKAWEKKGYKFNDKKLLDYEENVGLIAGYGRVRILDIDDEELGKALEKKMSTLTNQTGSGGKHFIFTSDWDVNKVLVNGLGEIRADKYMVVCPPSRHPNGNPYIIHIDKPIREISKEEFLEIVNPYLKQENAKRKMILTYKIKHNQDYSKELILAEKIAWHGRYTGSRSSADVKHIGLKSMIANQILKKYSNHKKLKNIKSVKLAIPGQGIKIKGNQIYLPCLKLSLDIYFNRNFDKINQIEIGKEFAYISVSYPEVEQIKPTSFFGVDRNSTSHVLVASNTKTGKVLKLGKLCKHIHNKYKEIRRQLGKKRKLKKLKSIKNRERRIIKNINHKISKALVKRCLKDNSAIVLEDLKGIRKTAKSRRKNRYTLNSWSFYQLQEMIEYKSKKLGIPIFYVEPQYTSQRCSRCGHIEKANRKLKLFQCKKCGKVENADVNAGFNIAELHQLSISQFNKESDLLKGNTDTPKEAMVLKSN